MEESVKMIVNVFFVLLLAAHTRANTWSSCSKSCGTGTQTRETCIWVTLCSTSHRLCNDFPCVSDWEVWQPCSKACGGGTQFKVVKSECSHNDKNKCPKTYQDCNTQACASVRCSTNYKNRYGDLSSCCKIAPKETCGVVAKTGSAQRVHGGKKAILGQWPWAAVMVKKKTTSTHCSGNLIHNNWVLTAAHCLILPGGGKLVKTDVYVLVGSISIKNPGPYMQKSELEDWVAHKDYDDNYAYHDVGLVKLKTAITYGDYVQPACLPSQEIVQQDTTCYVAGWGRVGPQGAAEGSDDLLQAAVRIVPLDACVQGLRSINGWGWDMVDKNQHICAGRLSGITDTCAGDSGGLLACQRCSNCNWYLTGTTSYGALDCGTPGVPAVYMNIRHYEHWIRQHIALSQQNHYVC